MVCWGNTADSGEGKHITTTNRKWHACVQRSVCTHKHPLTQTHRNMLQLPKTDIYFIVHSHTHKHSDHFESAGGVCQCGRTKGLVCSMVCDRNCLCHFTLCLQCLSESGARSGGVTALICHADRLGNEKSSQHRGHTRWEQTLSSVLLCISLLLHPRLDPTNAD